MRSLRSSAVLALAVVALSIVGLVAAAEPASEATPSEADGTVELAPVTLDGRELFRVRGITALPAQIRAKAISERLLGIARDRSVAPDSVTTVTADPVIDVVAGSRPIMMVSDADSQLAGVDRLVLAKALALRARRAIEEYRFDRSGPVLLRGSVVSAGAIAALALLLWLLRASFRRLEAALDRRYRERVVAMRIRSLPFLQSERVWTALGGTLRTIRVLVEVLAIAGCIQVVLGRFPWTRPVADGLLSYVVDPLRSIGAALLAYVPKLVFLIVLAVLTRWALKLLKLFFAGIESGAIEFRGFYPEWGPPTYRLVRLLVLAFVLVVAFPYLPGSESAAFKGVSLFLGVMFSLGSSSAISNLVAGYSMTYRRAYRVGDRVRIGDQVGDVEQTRLLVTHLRTIKNEEVVIPNSLILNSHVVNYSSIARGEGLILHTAVGIGYEVPWRQVEAMLLLAAARTPGLRAEPPPFVLQLSLGDYAVNYELNVYTDQPRRMVVTYAELHRNIQDVFNEHGVQIMTPSYVADPPEAKLVPPARWFEAPARPPAEGEGPRR